MKEQNPRVLMISKEIGGREKEVDLKNLRRAASGPPVTTLNTLNKCLCLLVYHSSLITVMELVILLAYSIRRP